MVHREGAAPPASFWRCGRCNTPNPWATYLTHCVGCGSPRPAWRAALVESAPGRAEQAARSAGASRLAAASWAYAATVLAVLATIAWLGERWWPATLLLFAPRWPLLVPVVALASAAGWLRRRRLWILHGAIALVVAGPLMGLSLPVGQFWAPRPAGTRLRIMTLNRGNREIDAGALIRLIEEEGIQILCFQEGSNAHEGRPDPTLEAYLDRGWHRNREKTIASRLPIVDDLPEFDDPDGEPPFWRARMSRVRLRAGSGAEFVLADLHLPSMSYAFDRLLAGDSRAMAPHLAWRERRAGLVAAALAGSADRPLLVAGDLNMPSDSPLMATFGLVGLRLGFEAAGWGYGYTRPSGFPWVRIDHILAGPGWTFTKCWVGPDLGSDHLPLLAEVVLADPSAEVGAGGAGPPR